MLWNLFVLFVRLFHPSQEEFHFFYSPDGSYLNRPAISTGYFNPESSAAFRHILLQVKLELLSSKFYLRWKTFDKKVTGCQRWKTVLLNLIMWLIYCNFVCSLPILLIWQMAQPSSGSTHTSKYKELIQRLRSITPTQPKGHCEPSSSL